MAIEILDSGACKAMGIVATSANVVGALTAGVRRVISTGVDGRVQLELEEGIGGGEFVAQVTCGNLFSGLGGVTCGAQWISPFVVELQTVGPNGLLAACPVRFAIYKIQGLGSPQIVPAAQTPLTILGAGNIVGWWDAAHTVFDGSGLAAGAVDQSGNGNDLAQATPGERFAVAPGVLGISAWQANGTPQSLFVTGLSPALGDKNTLWVVGRADPAIAAFASGTFLSNALITLVQLDVPVVALAQYAALANTTGGSGAWLSGIAPGTTHLYATLTDAGAAVTKIDGVVIPPAAGTTGGIAVASPRFEIGAGSVAVAAGQVPWTGQIYEALLTGPTALTPTEIAALELYFLSKYGL